MKLHLKQIAAVCAVFFALSGLCSTAFATESTNQFTGESAASAQSTLPDSSSNASTDSSSEPTTPVGPGDVTSSSSSSAGESASSETSSAPESSSSEPEASSNTPSSGNTSSAGSSHGQESSSSAPQKPATSEAPTIPDSFSVTSGGQNITKYFQINGHNVTGKVSHVISSIQVTIARFGVSKTVTYTFNEADGVHAADGQQFLFTMELVHHAGTSTVRDTYYITVTRALDPAASSSAISSTGMSSAHSSGTATQDTSSLPPSVGATSSGHASSDGSSSASRLDRFQGKNHSWLLPVAILLILLGAGGVFYVVWEILIMRGIIQPKKPTPPTDGGDPANGDEPDGIAPDDSTPDGFRDLFDASEDKDTSPPPPPSWNPLTTDTENTPPDAPDGQQEKTNPNPSADQDESTKKKPDEDSGKIDIDAFFNNK